MMMKPDNWLRFTEKEKRVFRKIIKYPHQNDTELSKKIGINRTTITAIRNKLYKRNFYSKIRIPKLCLAECEIFNVRNFRLNPLGISYKEKKEINELFESPEMIFGILSEDKITGIFLSKNYTELYKINALNKLSAQSDISEKICSAYFPIKLSKIPVFFNYTSLFEPPPKSSDEQIRDDIQLQKIEYHPTGVQSFQILHLRNYYAILSMHQSHMIIPDFDWILIGSTLIGVLDTLEKIHHCDETKYLSILYKYQP